MEDAVAGAATPYSTTMDWTPLILSTLAGLSTSLGASIAFFSSKERPMSDEALAFSLALAGSVMVTVSAVSLIPESLLEQSTHEFLAMDTMDFWKRVGGFLVGCAFYWMLSKAFPEPDTILNLESEPTDELLTEMEMDESSAYATSLSGTPPEGQPLIRDRGIEDDMEQAASAKVITPSQSAQRQKPSLWNSSHPRSDSVRIRSFRESQSPSSQSDMNDDAEVSHEALWLSDEKKESTALSWRSFSQGQDLTTTQSRRSWRVAMLLFVSLVVHNFPEGIAVGATAMHSPSLGLTTAIAIALHNIPEGIAIAVPCLAARPNAPWLAFGLASASGLAEPMGAAVAIFCLSPKNGSFGEPGSDEFVSMGVVLSFVAGVMVTVALMELFPEAMRRSSQNSMPMFWGSVVGAAVMVGSDLYLNNQS